VCFKPQNTFPGNKVVRKVFLKQENMKNILITIDFEEQANLLLDRAFELAEKFDCKLWLLHIAAPDPEFVGYEVGPQNERDFRAGELKTEHKIIEKCVHQLKEKGINAEGLLIQGPTVETILKEAEKLNIDLVIIGHHKHSLFYKTFVGNTDSALINKSKVPVLLVPIK
jgi:nucleotide-binding universal stress UspA family protein